MSLELTQNHMGALPGVLPQIPRLVYSVTFVFYIFLLIICSKLQHSPRQKREKVFFFVFFFYLHGEKQTAQEKKCDWWIYLME